METTILSQKLPAATTKMQVSRSVTAVITTSSTAAIHITTRILRAKMLTVLPASFTQAQVIILRTA